MKFVPSHRRRSIFNVGIRLCLMTLVSLAFASTSWATFYYVDKNNTIASDSNIGSESSPWKTISHAASTAIAGDTVYVKSGTYSEQVTVSHSGSSGSPITFAAYPGHSPVIDGSGVNVSSSNGLFTSNNHNYIILDGFEIKNSNEYLIRMYGGSYCEIKNCVVHDNVSSGQSAILFSHCTNGLFENNEVYHGGRNAVNFESDTDMTIQYNYIHDNSAHNGINLFPKTSETQIEYSGNNIKYNVISGCTHGIYSRYQTNNEISNNIIHDNLNNGIYLENDELDPHNFAAHTLIANNTITGNGQNGILDGNATFLTIKNNIIYNNASYSIYIRSSVNSNNTVSHNLTSNPSFTDASKNDFTLQSGSAAIDAGTDLSPSGITDDIAGVSRPQGNAYDIGAYEYTSGNTPNPEVIISPPANLRTL